MWCFHRTLGLAALLLLVLAACDPEVRAPKPEEAKQLADTMVPLLRSAFGEDILKCRPSVGIFEVPYFDVRMRLKRDENPCVVAVLVTAGAMAELKPRALQSLLAHELGHVQSRHQTGSERYREIVGSPGATGQVQVLGVSNQQFTPDEEAEADAAAARVLTDVWRGTNVGCLATADLYEDIRKDRSRWGDWLSRHPNPERRVDSVVKLCESELQRR